MGTPAGEPLMTESNGNGREKSGGGSEFFSSVFTQPFDQRPEPSERLAELDLDYTASPTEIAGVRKRNAHIPPRYQGKTLENFETFGNKALTDVRTFAGQYADTFNGGDNQMGLYLSGRAGCGKSHIAAAILGAVIERGFSGYWVNAPKMMSLIYDVLTRNAPSELLEPINAGWRNSELLVVDDLGASESPRGFALERLHTLINRRYESKAPMLITSNLTFGDLRELFKDRERIVSRIGEMCPPNNFPPFPDYDYRLRQMR